MSPELYALCLRVTGKRPRTVIDHILRHGQITTEELTELYSYDHPPRAIRDVRENGIPLETFSVISTKTGRKIGAYRFGDPSQIVQGRVGGRRAFSKQFKADLVEHYGSRSTLSGERLHPRYLQIDHRVPYQVAGDSNTNDMNEYMLLDASEQRAKSWSCEQCKNFRTRHDPGTCRRCFWAFPEDYDHVAMVQERRMDIVWREQEIAQYNKITDEASRLRAPPQEIVKDMLRRYLASRK
jgi:hypothetical protein